MNLKERKIDIGTDYINKSKYSEEIQIQIALSCIFLWFLFYYFQLRILTRIYKFKNIRKPAQGRIMKKVFLGFFERGADKNKIPKILPYYQNVKGISFYQVQK